MKPTNRWFKILVLSGFILLMSGFVAYRSGAFDNYLYAASPSGERYIAISDIDLTNSFVKQDTVPPKKRMMSGSKAMILIPPPIVTKDNREIITDTAEFVRVYRSFMRIKNDDSILQRRRMMASSSKSAAVFTPLENRPNEYIFINNQVRQATIPLIDSLIIEMRRLYPAVANLDSVKPTRPVMPSSKSGSIFRSKDLGQSIKGEIK